MPERSYRLHLGLTCSLITLFALTAAGVEKAASQPRKGSSQSATPTSNRLIFDSRKSVQPLPPRKATRIAINRFKRTRTQEVVELNPLTGTVSSLTRWEGEVSPQRQGTDVQIARDWLQKHYVLLGLDRDDLPSLHLVEHRQFADHDARVRFTQSYQGISAYDNSLTIYIQNDSISAVSGSPSRNLFVPSTTPKITATGALKIAARRIPGNEARINPKLLRTSHTPSRSTSFVGGHKAKLVLFTQGAGKTTLAWQVNYDHPDPALALQTVTDANTGRLLARANTVATASADVWNHYPGAPRGGGDIQRVDLSRWLAPNAGNELRSKSFRILTDDGLPITTPNGEWLYQRVPNLGVRGRSCPPDPIGCTWLFPVKITWKKNLEQAAVQLFYFLSTFREHINAAPIYAPYFSRYLFDVPIYLSNDPKLFNNAVFESQSRSIRFGLYGSTRERGGRQFRSVFSAEDAGVVYHEYAHGLIRALSFSLGEANGSPEGGAMNEGLADWYATDFLLQQGYLIDTEAPGEIHYFQWAEGEQYLSRTQPLDCTVGADPGICPRVGAQVDSPGQGGYTYLNLGRIDTAGAEPHSDGEILVETLLDLRRDLVAKLGSDEKGSFESERLITEGVQRLGNDPTFLSLRDGILAANVDDEIEQLIWNVFTNRGMGRDSSNPLG